MTPGPRSENNKRIAKNTLMLYFRMLLTMFVSLFTARVVFNTLGVVDYGVYNVVGSIVTMFSFLTGSMAVASERFFAFEIGKNDFLQLKRTFSLSVTIYVLIAIIILIFAETVGVWFLNNKIIIPIDRMDAAIWVYQLSILSFLVTLMIVPYHAAIIAHENMNVYAYIGIVDVILKLIILYMLVMFSIDKLKLYAILMFGTTCISSACYLVFCKSKYKECKFSFYWDSSLFKTLTSYVGWNLFGGMAAVLKNQGVNILLNIFFGPVINAARGIAYQVNAAVTAFSQNFTTAVTPQIIKSYAANDKQYMMRLVFGSAKFSYYLLLLVSLPILLETPFILTMWLKNPPDYAVLFTRLVIIDALINSFNYSLFASVQATGKLKLYQVVVGGLLLLNLPLSYVFLKLGYAPQLTMIIAIIISVIAIFLRLVILKGLVQLSIHQFVMDVLVVVSLVTVFAYSIPFLFMAKMDMGLTRLIVVTVIVIPLVLIVIYTIGISKNERKFFVDLLRRKPNQ